MENWAFLARFCFLSDYGEFEYNIEFDENSINTNLNLLLYYDTDDQWPAVYKTDKTCHDKESVLHIEQNQIINLTTKDHYSKDFAGCHDKNNNYFTTTVRPRYTLNIPTLPTHKTLYTTTTITTTTITPTTPSINDSLIEWLDFNQTITTTNQTKKIIKKRSSTSIPTQKRIICHNARRFKSARERWWFIAVSNCDDPKGIHIKYRLLMTNGPSGDYWHEHFSADEFFILPILLAFLIVYIVLLMATILCTIELKSRQLLHTTYKIYIYSIILYLFGLLLKTIGYLRYAFNGIGDYKLLRVGAIYCGASETCFLLLLLLMAKGYTITRGRLSLAASVKLTIFMCCYVVTLIIIFIYESKFFDLAEILYLYESPAGYGLIILRTIGWFMFIYATIFTLKRYPEKANFYYPFNVCATLWFISGSCFIIIANLYIDKWIRESIVCAIQQFIAFGGHFMFLVLTTPSVANKNFPYHVRTTQIGVMNMTSTDGGGGRDDMVGGVEHFGHHQYEPNIIQEQTVIVPLTRRTEEIFEGMYATQYTSRGNTTTNLQTVINQLDNSNNLMLENVARWSLARNLDAIPKLQTNSDGASQISENEMTDRQSPINGYIKDVPIELFTISRMVVGTTSKNNDN